MRIIKLREKLVSNVKRMVAIGSTFLITVVIPYLIYISVFNIALKKDVDLEAYLLKLQQITTFVMLLGLIITAFVFLRFLQRAYTIRRLIFSIIPEVLYCYHILIWSGSGLLRASAEDTTILIDFTILYFFMLVLPVLIIVWNLYNYIVQKQELKCDLFLLKVIYKAEHASTKHDLKKYIRGSQALRESVHIRNYLLKNLDRLLGDLASGNYPLITKTNKYTLTRYGKKVLLQYQDRKFFKRKTIDKDKEDEFIKVKPVDIIDGYEVWTEDQLRNYSKKRQGEEITDLEVWTEEELEKLASERSKS
ncbi:MAG: hypothetical protein ACFFAN_12885 [Promethearchaeota archaeon]